MPERSIGSYAILGELGHGGMGTVYRARDEAGQPVAIKVLAPLLARDESVRARFLREPTLYPVHPNVVKVLDVGEAGSSPYFVMELVEGQSLEGILQASRMLSLDQLMPVVAQVGAALDAVHRQNVIHRDIKPSNILVRAGDNHIFLTDFGVAKDTQATKLTRVSNLRVGTAHYMSPEQAMGASELTPAADVYALGVLVFRALSGRVPFDADSDVVVARMHMQDAPPDLSTVNPRISRATARVIRKALAKEPGKRFASAGDFARALEASQTQTGGALRNPVVWAGLAALVVLASAATAAWVLLGPGAANPFVNAGGPPAATVTPAQLIAAPLSATSTPAPIPPTDGPLPATSTPAPTATPEPTLVPTATRLERDLASGSRATSTARPAPSTATPRSGGKELGGGYASTPTPES